MNDCSNYVCLRCGKPAKWDSDVILCEKCNTSQVSAIFDEIKAIHKRKQHDYAESDDEYSNFRRAACLADWFDDSMDKVFATMIGIKLARLAVLRAGKNPLNESLLDSFLDLNTYTIIWHAFRRDNP